MPFIRMVDLAGSDLPAEIKTELLAIAMTDLAYAMALEIIHGDRWFDRYVSTGGRVRLDTDGEPMIWTEHPSAQAVQL